MIGKLFYTLVLTMACTGTLGWISDNGKFHALLSKAAIVQVVLICIIGIAGVWGLK